MSSTPSPPNDATPVLVIGEALVDAVERSGAPAVEHVGGSPANVAFGLAALGHDVALATWVGSDARGVRIADRCREMGTRLVDGSDGADHTSVARAVLDDQGAATYDFDITWQVPPVPDLGSFGHIHTGSIAAVLEPGGTQVLDLVERAGRTATVSYDPNARPSLMGSPDDVRPRMEALIASADVVKASDEDIAWLYPDRYVPDV
ncbi:MAG: PfkB family carbohydrate kinase, partial [Lapillicoccus sp.]